MVVYSSVRYMYRTYDSPQAGRGWISGYSRGYEVS